MVQTAEILVATAIAVVLASAVIQLVQEMRRVSQMVAKAVAQIIVETEASAEAAHQCITQVAVVVVTPAAAEAITFQPLRVEEVATILATIKRIWPARMLEMDM